MRGILVLGLVCLFVTSCVPGDPNPGGPGQECRQDGGCNVGLACSNRVCVSASDGGGDGSVSIADASTEGDGPALLDGGGADIGPDQDAASCPSIGLYCRTHACVEDWKSAEKPTTWCTTDAGAPYYPGFADVYIHPACGGFDVVLLSATDSGLFYLYDPDTGLLKGIGRSGSWSCVAGTLPAPFSFACGADGLPTPVCGP